MVDAFLKGIRWARPHEFHGWNAPIFEDEDEDQRFGEDDIAESGQGGVAAPQTPSPARSTTAKITTKQKDTIYKLHVNTGHLPVPQMLAMLKAAGARDEVRDYVKNEFHCLQCMKQQKPVPHKKATFPKSFTFNKLVGIDYFFISFLGKTHAFLNVICMGTNLQQVALLPGYVGGPPNARDTWNLFSKLWLQPFGLPETLICDQGSEFKGHFERALEQVGTFQAVIDGAAPWQNGKTERHGSWLKTRLEEELQSGQTIVQSSIEPETLAQLVTSHKNRWFHRGGYSPYQLVFGVNPRVPLELLSDDHMIIAGADDAGADPFEADGPAAEFARAHAIRQRARELCIASNLKDRVRLSLSHNMHQQKQWAPNQWVYVWRKFPGTGGGHTTRARWIGPGLVIMQQGNTVWVSMRARIWKCSSNQLRSASHLETLGAELTKAQGLEDILNQAKSKQAGAVDVAAEGPPERDAWSQPAAPEGEASPALPDVESLQQQQEQARLPPVPEDEVINIGHGMIRQILPQPVVGDSPGAREPTRTFPRQHSQATQEEPNVEPVPSDASDSTDSSKRRKTITGPPEPRVEVRQRVADLESKRLEREALRFLKRLDREERQQSRETASSSSAALPSSAAQPVSGPGTTPTDLEESAPIPDAQDDDLLSFFDVCPSKEDILEKGSLPFCEMSISQDSERPSFLAKPTKAKNSEFDMKQATPEEIKGFEASDLKEWEAILNMGSVRVLSKEESLKVIANSPERVITSRMIRRKKPVPGVGNFKFKSRWCLHGHQDPDSMSGSFQVFSSMPSCESITLFFQIAINEQLLVCFLDIQNAFCQADRLDRPQGKLYAVPCSGLKIPQEQLIEIIAPIYGLDDSPLRWHRALINFFQGLGFEKNHFWSHAGW